MGGELEPDISSWPVLARHPLTADRIITASEAEPGSGQAKRVLNLHELMRSRTRLYAQQLELLIEFFTQDPEAAGCLDDAAIAALKIALGMRTSTSRAESLIRDVHRAVDLMPKLFVDLESGDLPEDWHQYLLRHVRRLTDEQTRTVDHHVASWDLASISRSQFERHLRHLVALVTAGDIPTPPETLRRVDLEVADARCGTATLSVTGPIPEIKALAHRLDVSARAVQQAQRGALQDGEEGPIPFDIDDNIRQRGRPLSLAALQYAILTHSILDTDPVPEPAQPYRILVTVPALTLLGTSNAPAMLDGLTPIPAEQARVLAAGQDRWHRILTDPTTGAFLPLPSTTYRPTAQMREQLRLRHPVCAVPGCHRPTALAAEDDHIIEYDHDHPERGGRTSLLNLHRLCWRHHQLKTAGRIDPERIDPTTTSWDIDSDLRAITRDNTDLATPLLVEALDAAWRTHLRAHDDAVRLQHEERSRPRNERITEQRQHEQRRFHPRRRIIPPPSSPPPEADDPPLF